MELYSNDACSHMGIYTSQCAIPRGDELVSSEAPDLPYDFSPTRARGDDYVGIQAVARGSVNKRGD